VQRIEVCTSLSITLLDAANVSIVALIGPDLAYG
jgi:hypothetical protein